MALVVKDRVQESSTTTGTGTLTLGGALTGFQSFSSAIGNGNTTYYAITLNGEWEVGIGTVGAGTLTRDTVLESSNSGSLVNFSAGTKNVFCTYPAEKSVDIDTPQTFTNKTISADSNTLSGIAASSFVLSNASGNIDGSAAQKLIPSGAVVGTTDTQTLSNKSFSSSVAINGSTSGSITLSAPAVAGTTVLTLPATSGTVFVSGQSSTITSGTSVSASGTSIDFTSIPSWVKRITVNLGAISTNGTSINQVQIGSGSVQTSGYNCTSSAIEGSAVGASNASSGFILDPGGSASFSRSGEVVLVNLGSNFWLVSYNLLITGASNPRVHMGAGNSGFLSGTLDRVRITTVNGTDTFDAGLINILYE